MQEIRTSITRSYSQKVNTGNYTSQDYFCSITREYFGGLTFQERLEESNAIHELARMDVESSIKGQPAETELVNEEIQQIRERVIASAGQNIPVTVDDYELATQGSPETVLEINIAKNKYARENPQPLRNPGMVRGKTAAAKAFSEKLKALETIEDKSAGGILLGDGNHRR